MAMSRAVAQLDPDLLARMEEARARTDALFKLLPLNSFYDRPIPERHRLIFYLGHLEAFDGNLLRPVLGLESPEPALDRLFAFGIDPVDGKLPTDTPADWPSIGQVEKYNRGVRETLDEALAGRRAIDSPSSELADGTLLHVAIEHRLMHAETLAYLFHNLPVSRKQPQASPKSDPRPAPKPGRVTIPAGIATLGRSRNEAFGWDNEFEAHLVEVPTFSIDAFPVSNGEYLKFVEAGGYQEARYWSPESWEWKSSVELAHPHFWVRPSAASPEAPCQWNYRAMFGTIPLPLSWPVYVSHGEASAYARWAGRQLPSEAQWHRAAYGSLNGRERTYPWGDAPPDPTRGNFDFQSWDAAAVDAHPTGASAFGVFDLLGNGWEWTSTPFAPFPGFRAFSFYPGYSANFFDGKHFVMKGGSPQTDRCMLRRAFRNWFQPHYTYTYATFRCVEE
ncbi:MAG TPA: SUMF1/EgtB/PvdO family nonheme iron enzyme [Candidatus Acidoferrales bacterium]|nr:SUMF1/EgtB/PvdO family nonheme iron enzyme [Candidatus Acidoferrales bacterium]